MKSLIFKRVIEELSQLIGFKEPESLVKGDKLRIGECRVTFIHDPKANPNDMFVYVDMGPLDVERKDAYLTLLKINFELDSGTRGVFSMHPETNHLFYSFRCELNEHATGRHLLGSLVRFIGGAAFEGLCLPKEENKVSHPVASGSRSNAARLIAAAEHGRY